MCFCSILIVKLILNYQEPIDHRKVSVGQPPAVPVQNSYERGHSWAQACTLALLCGRRAGVQGHRRGQGLGRKEQGQDRAKRGNPAGPVQLPPLVMSAQQLQQVVQ